MDTTSDIPNRATDRLQLSLVQKCDLAGQAVAAVITAALIAAPFVMSGVPAQFAHVSRVEAVISTGHTPDGVDAAVKPEPSTAVLTQPRPMLSARSTHLQAAGLRGELSPGRAATTAKKYKEHRPLGRKLAGLFTGDGSYAVRPFPTLER